MKGKQKLGIKILQILSLIVLIFTVISCAFYFTITVNLDRSTEKGTIPQIFGHQYILMQNKNLDSVIPTGSLVFFDMPGVENLEAGDLVLYKTPSSIAENKVYQDYSMGIIDSVKQDEPPSFQIKIENPLAEAQTATVGASFIESKGVYSSTILGGMVSMVLSQAGLLCFVIAPIFVLLLLQLFVQVLKISRNAKIHEETPVEPVHRNVREDLADFNLQQQTASVRPKEPVKTAPPAQQQDAQIKSETVSSMESGFSSREKLVKPFTLDQDALERDLVFDYENMPAPVFQEKTNQDMVDELLMDIPYLNYEEQHSDTLEQIEEAQEISQLQHTLEFDRNQIREKMLKEELLKDYDDKSFVKMPETNNIFDNIMIDLKENAIDVDFENIHSDEVQIEPNEFGDGFVIKTPNYKANVKIELTK